MEQRGTLNHCTFVLLNFRSTLVAGPIDISIVVQYSWGLKTNSQSEITIQQISDDLSKQSIGVIGVGVNTETEILENPDKWICIGMELYLGE